MTPRSATAVMFFINGALMGTWAAHIPFVRDEFALSKSSIGLYLLALAAGALVAMPATGRLLDRWRSAGIVRAAALTQSCLLVLLAVATGTTTLVVALVLFGVANGVFDVSMNAHGGAIEADTGRPIMSSLHAGWSLGNLAGAGCAALSAVLALPPRAGLIGSAVLLLGLGLLAAPRLGAANARPRIRPPRRRGRRRLTLPARATLVLGGLAAIAMLADGSIVNWSALYARDDLAGSAGLGALAYGAFALGMAASRLVGDRCNERFGTASLARAGSGVAAIALGGTLLLASPIAMLPGLVLVGAGTANTVPLLFSASLRTASGAPARSLATVTTLGFGGQLLGPPLVGFLADATSLTSALAMIAVVYGVIAIAVGAAFTRDKRTVRPQVKPGVEARIAQRRPDG